MVCVPSNFLVTDKRGSQKIVDTQGSSKRTESSVPDKTVDKGGVCQRREKSIPDEVIDKEAARKLKESSVPDKQYDEGWTELYDSFESWEEECDK